MVKLSDQLYFLGGKKGKMGCKNLPCQMLNKLRVRPLQLACMR